VTKLIDLSTELAGRYAAKLVADAGWDVTRVVLNGLPDDASGARDQALGPIESTLQAGGAAVELDWGRPEDRQALGVLLDNTDFVVHTFRARMADAVGLGGSDGLRPTVVAITGYGLRGPYSGRPYTDKTLYSHAGGGLIAGAPERHPLIIDLPIPSMLGGIYGAMSMHALALAGRTAAARPRTVDISLFDLLIDNLEKLVVFYTYLHAVPYRATGMGRTETTAAAGVFRVADGEFHVFAGYQPVSAIAEMINRPELGEDPMWSDPTQRATHTEEINAQVAEAIRHLTTDELTERARSLRVPCGTVNNVSQLFADLQFAHRETLRVDESGVHVRPPYRLVSPPAETAPAPGKPAGPVAAGPLAGIRVLDLTQAYAGPTATRLLAEFGADVIKIESTSRLDVVPRGLFPADNDTSGDWWERSGYFAERNMNKRGITLDLASDAGRDVFRQLLPHADVVISNFTPRVMTKWGLGPDELLAERPDLVVINMAGFGSSGPDRDRAALAGTMEAVSGFISLVRYADDDLPASAGHSFGDMVSGLFGALGVLAALDRRERTGVGGFLDFACAEAPIPFLVYQLQRWVRTGQRPSAGEEITCSGHHHLVRCTAHGDTAERWVLAHVPDRREGELAEVLDTAVPVPRVPAEFASCGLTQQELVARLVARDIVAVPLSDAEQILLDPHLYSRGVFEVVDRPSVSPRPYARLLPVLADGTPLAVDLAAPPTLGQHNDEVLRSLAHATDVRLAQLREDGVIGDRPRGGLPRGLARPVNLEHMAAIGRARLVPDIFETLETVFGSSVSPAAAAGVIDTQEVSA
jgi:crotonobetainyl-CoA:carnitine CoA-transferase CaiB-like acyl-CoA transferase